MQKMWNLHNIGRPPISVPADDKLALITDHNHDIDNQTITT